MIVISAFLFVVSRTFLQPFRCVVTAARAQNNGNNCCKDSDFQRKNKKVAQKLTIKADFSVTENPTAVQAMGFISECSALRRGLSNKFYV
ncbi:hypothetical protein CTM63_09905 [Prevotella intermedia]|uniref:Uncharacterized protein n=1 Tax=Prevotella intermedia TaxID=28131 RepID=A0A2M8M3F3_PREIN|nr:hypothetical protein CTM63_09905 [Prevotella intermedia]PJE98716.1 hypothetical protein CUB97_10020 [Prevotella intermedia]